MEELGSLWRYEEGIDEVKQKLMYTSLELESVRLVADEEIKKHKENVTSLLNLLKVAYQERDEAREQLRTLVNKLKPMSPVDPQPAILVTHNSSVTESNSQNSSPVSSPGLSTRGILVNQEEDPLERLVKGKVLPEKGRLLQAVMDAGPLLSNVMVGGGPLPRWRNPPPLQAFKIPPVSVSINAPQSLKQFHSTPYFDVSCGSSSQLSSGSPMLNFRTGPCLNNGRLMLTSGADTGNHQIPLPKRQRFF